MYWKLDFNINYELSKYRIVLFKGKINNTSITLYTISYNKEYVIYMCKTYSPLKDSFINVLWRLVKSSWILVFLDFCRKIITQVRVNNHRLNIEVGRYRNVVRTRGLVYFDHMHMMMERMNFILFWMPFIQI